MDKPTRPITLAALHRVIWACEQLAEGYSPGNDVTLFRGLRELHRCLAGDEHLDPHRLVRYALFNGLAEMSSWTDADHYCTTHEVYGDFCVGG